MSSIFGDSDDITFGNAEPSRSEKSLPSKEKVNVSPLKSETPPVRTPFPKKEYRAPLRKERSHDFPGVPSIQKPSLIRLIDSMKPSFLPISEGSMIRLVSLSPVDVMDPMVLIRTGESTLLFGTGFSQVQNTGTSYVTFPDMRLASHEKDRLSGWILLSPVTQMVPFQMMLEAL